ncbi:hypothetical protein MLD38_014055 [Melastoma candidum]|uniref:Uncharacterized protein n=1 Tax=Melastoma candidum TaxID=119954 RepID=A0ACB9RBH8_9MYRT|nr:hypothetical protein MLD38_014055 [Melastoma candidum]
MLLGLSPWPAPFRKRTSNPYTIFPVWSAYFLSNRSTIFAFGLIPNSGCRTPPSAQAGVDSDVLALWTAFLMMHFDGPDSKKNTRLCLLFALCSRPCKADPII